MPEGRTRSYWNYAGAANGGFQKVTFFEKNKEKIATEEEAKKYLDSFNAMIDDVIEAEKDGTEKLKNAGIELTNSLVEGSVGAIKAAITQKQQELEKVVDPKEYQRIEDEIKVMQAKLEAITGKSTKKENAVFDQKNRLLEIISKKQNQNYQILWAAGPAQYEKIKNELKEKYSIEIDNIEDVSIVPYIYNMEEIMNIVDLVVSRSGAMTITEIANVGVPAIFIPFPFATENHQEYNAKVLENVGAAKIILDKNLTSNELNSTITNLVENKNALKDMGKKANQVAIQNVEEKIYKEIKEL